MLASTSVVRDALYLSCSCFAVCTCVGLCLHRVIRRKLLLDASVRDQVLERDPPREKVSPIISVSKKLKGERSVERKRKMKLRNEPNYLPQKQADLIFLRSEYSRTGSTEKEHRSLNKQIEFLRDRAVLEESRRETEVHKATGRRDEPARMSLSWLHPCISPFRSAYQVRCSSPIPVGLNFRACRDSAMIGGKLPTTSNFPQPDLSGIKRSSEATTDTVKISHVKLANPSYFESGI